LLDAGAFAEVLSRLSGDHEVLTDARDHDSPRPSDRFFEVPAG
jgi:hypothetical protein